MAVIRAVIGLVCDSARGGALVVMATRDNFEKAFNDSLKYVLQASLSQGFRSAYDLHTLRHTSRALRRVA